MIPILLSNHHASLHGKEEKSVSESSPLLAISQEAFQNQSADRTNTRNVFFRAANWCKKRGKNIIRKIRRREEESLSPHVVSMHEGDPRVSFSSWWNENDSASSSSPFSRDNPTPGLDQTSVENEWQEESEFTFVSNLGRGYFGYVTEEQVRASKLERSKYYQTKSGKQKFIAVKRPRDISTNSESGRVFNNEGRILESIFRVDPKAKRYIPKSYFADEEMIVMKKCNNGSLREFYESKEWKSLPPIKKLQVFAKAAEACAYLESLQIIHDDIAARNFLLHKCAAGEWKVYITDFGLAKMLDIGSKICMVKEVMGNPRHMSPEKTLGILSTKSDSWSFGIFLIEMVIGPECFYQFLNLTSHEFALRTRRGERNHFLTDYLQKRCDEIHPHLFDVIDRATIPDYHDRASLQKIASKLKILAS